MQVANVIRIVAPHALRQWRLSLLGIADDGAGCVGGLRWFPDIGHAKGHPSPLGKRKQAHKAAGNPVYPILRGGHVIGEVSPPWFHAVADDEVGATLGVAALLRTSAPDKAVATVVVVVLVVLVVRVLTKWPGCRPWDSCGSRA